VIPITTMDVRLDQSSVLPMELIDAQAAASLLPVLLGKLASL
jgi:hypothetical protein